MNRHWIVCALLISTACVIALSVILLYPIWARRCAVQAIIAARDLESVDNAIEHWKLTEQSDAVLPELCEALKLPGGSTRLNVTYAIYGLKPASPTTVPSLIRVLRDEGAEYSADERVQEINSQGQKVTLTIIRNERDKVHWWAILALGAIGTEATQAVPELLEALNDESWTIRESAEEALNQIDPDGEYRSNRSGE
jgi:HEAT repeat protein